MTSRSERGAPMHRVLLTGATGYVGGRLLRALEDRGHRVRCLARNPEHLTSRVAAQTEVVRGDVVSGEGLAESLSGIETAYYMVHSMGSAGGFEQADRRAATNFGAAARAAGVRRIVYLGGLADESEELSPHLRSRLEVGRLLRESGVPVIELRASIVIGSGSLSFEMIRALVEHLPLLVMPRWVSMQSQPIGIDDLIAYLLEAMRVETSGHAIYEIGGADRLSYADLMREYARQRGLRRMMLPVPVLTPRLSSLWLGLVTPLYARIGRKLIDSIRHASIVRDDAARCAFTVVPSDAGTAIARALENEDREFAETRWSDALSASGATPPSFGGVRIGPRLLDSREVELPVRAPLAFAAVRRIGGRTGWYRHDWLWQLRGLLDLMIGGAGMRRGRRAPDRVTVGDTIDCWRVTGFVPDRSLRLEAEMRLPGRAWLEFEVAPCEGGSRLRQTAVFQPSGLVGLAYWYAVYPLHALVFRGMIQGIAGAVLDANGPSASQRVLTRCAADERERTHRARVKSQVVGSHHEAAA